MKTDPPLAVLSAGPVVVPGTNFLNETLSWQTEARGRGGLPQADVREGRTEGLAIGVDLLDHRSIVVVVGQGLQRRGRVGADDEHEDGDLVRGAHHIAGAAGRSMHCGEGECSGC